MICKFLLNSISSRDTQLKNVLSSIRKTWGGILIFLRLVHPLNAFAPMQATDDGISILVSELHPSKHESSIIWVYSGIVISRKLVQPLKHPLYNLIPGCLIKKSKTSKFLCCDANTNGEMELKINRFEISL